MVTLSPTLGIAPSPSLRTVFVTPMIADVREKRRIVLVVLDVARDGLVNLRSFDAEEENMVEGVEVSGRGEVFMFLPATDDVVSSAQVKCPFLTYLPKNYLLSPVTLHFSLPYFALRCSRLPIAS